jgi:hypothetical protein
VPVTAKLSRQFYEKLGDQIANELVDWLNAVDDSVRSQLLELNERNWERLRAELDARDARLDVRFAAIDGQFAEFAARLDVRFAQEREYFGDRLAGVETRLTRWMVGLWLTTLLTIIGLRLL